MTDCKLASGRGNERREDVPRSAAARPVGLGPARTQTGFLRNVVIREGRRTGELQVRLVTSPGQLDAAASASAIEADGVLWTQTESLGESTQGGTTQLLARVRPAHGRTSATCAS